MTLLSVPYDSPAADSTPTTSRPLSAFCASDEEDHDPWATPGVPSSNSVATAFDPEVLEQDRISQYPNRQSTVHASSPIPPTTSDEQDDTTPIAAGEISPGVARKTRGSDELPRYSTESMPAQPPAPLTQQQQQHQPQQRQQRRQASNQNTSSSLDPWASTTAPQPSSGWTSAPPNHLRSPPPNSSSIRGGFTGTLGSNGHDDDDGDFQRQQLAMSTPRIPGPSSLVSVQLRPDVEGMIFKYNSYNILRRPLATGNEADDLAASSARLLETTRKTRNPASRQTAEAYTTTTTSPLRDSPTSLISASNPTSTVVRRYSDFVWLNEILLKRYPFRIVPVLPPKRLSIPLGARNLSDGFIEKRRRGLQRYLSAIASHPVLSVDNIVHMFLTDKQAISEYKLSHTNISLEEEALLPQSPSTASLVTVPRDLSTKIDFTSQQTPGMVEKWTTLCTLFERIAKRIEAQGGEYARVGSLIDAIGEAGGQGAWGATGGSRATGVRSSSALPLPPSHSSDPLMSSSALASSLHRDFSDLCLVRSRSLTLHALEGLKTQRDLWLAWRDLLNRHTASLSMDLVSSKKSELATTKVKLAALQSTPPAQRPPTFHADVARVEEEARLHSLDIERLMRRRDRIRQGMWEELNLLAFRRKEVGETWSQWCKEELLARAAQKRAVQECWASMSARPGVAGRV